MAASVLETFWHWISHRSNDFHTRFDPCVRRNALSKKDLRKASSRLDASSNSALPIRIPGTSMAYASVDSQLFEQCNLRHLDLKGIGAFQV
jgi:hypothetical protein